MNRSVFVTIAAILILGGLWLYSTQYPLNPRITNFEECARAGYLIMESYPRQCRTSDGKIFTEETDNLTVNVFFSSKARDSGALDCEKVYPVERKIPNIEDPVRAALRELLKGPTANEANKGFFTNINPAAKVQKLIIANKIAKVDFNDQLEFQVGGSCKVLAIRSQIKKTLKQFPTVNQVQISINGMVDEILQP